MSHNPDKLLVVKRGYALSIDVHRMAERHCEDIARVSPGLRKQLLRAVNSVVLNLTEGAGQHSKNKTISFCTTAIASCNEVELQMRLGRALGALPDQYDVLIEEVIEIRKMTFGFRKHVQGRSASKPHSATDDGVKDDERDEELADE